MSRRWFAVAGVALLVGIRVLFDHYGASSAVVENTTASAISVTLQTDAGESYDVGAVQPFQSVQVALSGRDSLVWVVARFPEGREVQSEKIYSTSGVNLSASVGNDRVEIQ